jgi:hypothetical protein
MRLQHGLVVAWLADHQLPWHMQDCGHSSIMVKYKAQHGYVLRLGKLNLSYVFVRPPHQSSGSGCTGHPSQHAACVWRSGGVTNTLASCHGTATRQL